MSTICFQKAVESTNFTKNHVRAITLILKLKMEQRLCYNTFSILRDKQLEPKNNRKALLSSTFPDASRYKGTIMKSGQKERKLGTGDRLWKETSLASKF